MANQPNSDAQVMAGIPERNAALYHRLRFSVGDPAAVIDLAVGGQQGESILILRDIEMQRARQQARVDRVACPADYPPEGGLSGDRETATAQAVAECLRRQGARRVVADRSLPLLYAEMIRRAGIDLVLDAELGVLQRRSKDEQELKWLQEAQSVTEGAMRMACELVAHARANAGGTLTHDGQPLTAQRVRAEIDHWLLDRGYANPPAIVAGGPAGADCHNLGQGPLMTEQPVIIDIFPCNRATHYNGDCTRTVVHGKVSAELVRMHEAVCQAKAAAMSVTRAGVSGEAVHLATSQAIRQRGFEMGLPGPDDAPSYCAMTHGTGHGVGLDVHEPPLLDMKGPELVAGDVLTIEPGLYRRDLGGLRVEDMVVVTPDGCENFNTLPEGLDWA